MKTCAFQEQEDEILILPVSIALEVIERIKQNPKCFIHLISPFWDGKVLKFKIIYHYE